MVMAQNKVGCNGASTQPGLWHCHVEVHDAHGCLVDAHMSSYHASQLIRGTLNGLSRLPRNGGALLGVAAPIFLPTVAKDIMGEGLEDPLPTL